MTYSQLKLELYGERAKLDRYLKHVEGRSHSALVSRLLQVQRKYTLGEFFSVVIGSNRFLAIRHLITFKILSLSPPSPSTVIFKFCYSKFYVYS